MTLRTVPSAMRQRHEDEGSVHRLLDGNFNQSHASRRGVQRAIILQETPMSPNADGNNPIDPVGSFARTTAQGLGSLWGMMLEHLSEKHAKAAAAWSENQEGGVGRTPDGILVTSKELVMQVLLNADGNYTIEGYQARMNQSIGLIYLGMEWVPEYVNQATKSNDDLQRS